jgi:hypothetical protein
MDIETFLVKEPKEIDLYVVNELITQLERKLLWIAVSRYKSKKISN